MSSGLLFALLVIAAEPAQRYVVQADQHLVEAHHRSTLTAEIGRPEGPLWVSVGAAVTAERLELRLIQPDIVAWWRADLSRLRDVLKKHRTVGDTERTRESEP